MSVRAPAVEAPQQGSGPAVPDPDPTASIVHSFEEADRHEVDLSGYAPEDWVAMMLLWVMALFAFLQFFTRYVLNDSFAWTEELAVYCLIGVVFIGGSMCVRTHRHIQVDIVYRWLPARAGRALSTVIDLASIAFFAYGVWLLWRYIVAVGDEPMTTVPWKKNYVYWLALAGFVLMLWRACQGAWRNWRRGYSALDRPEVFESH